MSRKVRQAMAKKASYWERRRAQMMYEQMEIAEKAAATIGTEYRNTAKYVHEKIKNNYAKTINKFKINDKDMLKLMKEANAGSYNDLIKMAERKGMTELASYLKQPGQRYKYERLMEQAENIDNAINNLAGKESSMTSSALKEVSESTYYKSIYEIQKHTGLAFSFNEWDEKLFSRLAGTKWSGENYSKRIWNNTGELAATLKSEIIQGFIAGKTQKEMYKVIMERFGAGAFNAKRIVRTESCYAANEMEMQSYEECGIDTYIFVATLDLRTSDVCAALDGKVFKVKDAMPGVNMPPMHPFCRSTTIENIGTETLKKLKRRARNPVTGKNELVPADMTYKEWHKKYVEGNREAVVNAQATRNHTADEKQYSKYMERLGKEYAGKDLKEFQNIKYTNPEKYAIMKAQYKGAGYYDKAVAAEPEVTKLVEQTAKQNNMQLAGLDHRIKDKSSYLDKIAREYKPGYHYEVKDVLRYTMVSMPEELVNNTLKSIEMFNKENANVYQIKNLWLNKKNPYNGINTYVQDKVGNKFEVQYHTEGSYMAKQKTHVLYEKIRKGNMLPDDMRKLTEEMREVFDSVEVPKNIERIVSYG